MRPDPAHGSPEAWLARAWASLALARQEGQGILFEDLCYQAQQAAEKALKALLIAHGMNVIFTHDLDRLVLGLESVGIPIPEAIDQATLLTRYAIETRYPGAFEPIAVAEYQDAIRMAETILFWVSAQIKSPA